MPDKIYIISPVGATTGGMELLQQLCFCLNSFGLRGYMFYIGEFKGSQMEHVYAEYRNPSAVSIEDSEKNIIIVPEVYTYKLYKFNRIKKYIWWLSVDNYQASGKKKYTFLKQVMATGMDFCNRYQFKKVRHLFQSEYARQYLIYVRKIKEDQVMRLSDYLNAKYFMMAENNIEEKRQDWILYNPKKGMDFTYHLIKKITEYTWIPLQNMNIDEMYSLMQKSKVYVDFGNHPGKDRIPREAAICGCCVITGKKGAAENDIDIPIKNEYKFDDFLSAIDMIHQQIVQCMEYYEEKKKDFDEYRECIRKEEKLFHNDIKRIFGVPDVTVARKER